MKNYLSGLKFGMLLQLAIGPMCLLVFNTAKNAGFMIAMSLVLAIALIDSFYILLASLGVSKFLNKSKLKKVFSIISAIILVIFGLNISLGIFGINLIPSLNVTPTTTNIFLQGIILTLSNPITIIFWGSVLTTKIIEDNLTKSRLFIFSTGLISATLIFLTSVAILGTILSEFITSDISNVLNLIVGILIVIMGIKMLFTKDEK